MPLEKRDGKWVLVRNGRIRKAIPGAVEVRAYLPPVLVELIDLFGSQRKLARAAVIRYILREFFKQEIKEGEEHGIREAKRRKAQEGEAPR